MGDALLYRSAFTNSLFARGKSHTPDPERFERELVIRTCNPRVARDEWMAITGNQACLGDWDTARALRMDDADFPSWEIRLDADKITFPLEYKFIVINPDTKAFRWETGENRILAQAPTSNKTVSLTDSPFREGLPLWKGAGTVAPVFSLRSENSFGIGDFHDVKLLIDWAFNTNQRLIQVLPLNDTSRTHTWEDSYPYSAISIYALHPIYIALHEMGALDDAKENARFRRIQRRLNKKETVDYEEVEHHKLAYCRAFFARKGRKILESDAFGAFWESNREWLEPYAAFCYLRDKYGTPDFNRWDEYAVYHPEQVRNLCTEASDAYPEISFSCFLQFVLHTQFKAVSDYAREKGVILKGDLPIGIHRTSVEAWTETSLFNMQEQAGAPPDAFSDTGQNWSFPTYNWDVMEKDGYSWWKKRFRKLEAYFDCFRIDHILGFFRIWEIPLEYTQGLCGHFRPALPYTIEEIENYGLKFSKLYVIPHVRNCYLETLFGEEADGVTHTFLMPYSDACYTLKPVCDTQRKIETLFTGKAGATTEKIKNGLMAITNEMLFLEDPYEKGKYHPRISGCNSFVYKDLTPEERDGFDRLSHHFFYERHHTFWKEEALKRLTPLIASTAMLICGEDLGMIPDSVHEVMTKLHILSLELERAPKIFGETFADLQKLPYMSVCTTSTHDMNPLRAWWNEQPERTQQYYNSVLHQEGKAPEECTALLAAQILANHLNATSMLTIIPIQDWLAMSDALRHTNPLCERINIPADPHHYWRYRMHLTLEQLLNATDFNDRLRSMIADSGR